MSSITSLIERFLKKMLELSEKGDIEIQRNELAQKFSCAPSQINYVLATRFSMEQGYVIESRRGGGGYIRIKKIPQSRDFELIKEICDLVGDAVSEQVSRRIIERLYETDVITKREAMIMEAIISRNVLRLGLPARDQLRASIMRAIMETVLQHKR